MKRTLAAALLLFSAVLARAGGDYVEGLVTTFSGSEGVYSFHFAQSELARPALVGIDCREFDVSVRYPPTPWYSWLPWVQPFYPTLKDTTIAADYLKQAADKRHPINFGYMGSGLVPSGPPCHFESHGLELSVEPGRATAVLAHHKPA